MKTLSVTLVALLILSTTTVRGDGLEPAQKRPGQIVKPIAPVALPKYRVTVQSKPKFPNQKRPKESEAVTEKGLSVTIQPERKKFAGNGPLAFEVEFKNVSDQPFLLYGAELLGQGAKLVVSNQKTAAQWEPGSPTKGKDQPAVELKAGKSLKYTLVVEGVFAFPQPIPLPRPIPQPLPRPIPERKLQQDQAGTAAQVDRRGPVPVVRPVPPVVIGPVMPCGKGPCRARLLLEFTSDPRRRYATPQWTGKIASGPVDFEVGDPEPVRPPVIGPPVIGPINKEKAVTLAQAAAERALQANYQPKDPVRPPHEGAWITDPQKTAAVKERKGGGWTVSWTQVPAETGFTFNVTVDVTAGGATVVREVFTAYSPR